MVAEALNEGWAFGGLHASDGGAVVRTLLVSPGGSSRLESVATVDGAVASIVDLTAAAAWDEREAHDLYGVTFEGHEPMRPLVDHDPELARWTVPVQGDGPYQVAVGPIHAGVIESGHFRFHVVGDRILLLDARLFYKHRGLERAAEGQTPEQGIRFVERACAACSVSSPLAYAQACEDAAGLGPNVDLARTRTMLLELERLWNHVNDLAAVCAGVGLAAGNMRFAELTERARQLNAVVTGHRFLRGTVAVGGSPLELAGETIAAARTRLDELDEGFERGWRELVFNTSFQERLERVGVVSRDDAARLGAVGPAARASGVAVDLRTVSPLLSYAEHTAVVPSDPSGDVRARVEQRALELRQTIDLLRRLLEQPHHPSAAEPTGAPRPFGVGRVEGPRGATSCVIESSGRRLARLRLRTGSYSNWPVVAFAAAGEMLPDFPLINKSFELCYACADR